MKLKESDETNNPCQQERNRNMQQKMVHFNSELIMHCEKEAGRAGKGFFFPFSFFFFCFFLLCVLFPYVKCFYFYIIYHFIV